MNKRIFILLSFCLIVSFGKTQTYNTDEVAKLKMFLNQPSSENGKTNGQQLNTSYDENDPSTWEGINWTETTPKRVTNLNWLDKYLCGFLDVSNFEQLVQIVCQSNELDSIYAKNCPNLTQLQCFTNQLVSLDVSNSSALTLLSCDANLLELLNISGCTNLLNLGFAENQLTKIDLSDAVNLKTINCMNNDLTSIDFTKNSKLETFQCVGNQLTSLDFSPCPNMIFIECSYNPISSLNVSNCGTLQLLHCIENQLTSIDISSSTKLTELYCSDNQISTIDISNNDSLIEFSCNMNQLSVLDVSNNLKLKELRCSNNQIKSLDLSSNLALEDLVCYNNKLSYLDLSGLLNFDVLLCDNNALTFSSLVLPENLSDTITYDYVPQEDIIIGTLNGDSYEHDQEDTVDLSSEYLGGNTTYTWKYNNSGLPVVTGITDHQNGKFSFGRFLVNAEIYCELTNDSFPDFAEENVLKTVPVLITGIPSGLKPLSEYKPINIYPNPVVDILNIEGIAPYEQIQIIDVNGSVVYCSNNASSTTFTLCVNELPKGSYILKTGKQTSFFLKK